MIKINTERTNRLLHKGGFSVFASAISKLISNNIDYIIEKPGRKTDFVGHHYKHSRDRKRLAAGLLKVFNVIKDGIARTKFQIAVEAGLKDIESVTRYLRYLREDKYGGYNIKAIRKIDGLYEYQMFC